jgi:hypothetical protein
MAYETVVYERTRLYEEVWAEPVEVVAKRYGVSRVALAKTCRKLGVPLPGRGYWAQKRAGRKLKRPPLRAARKGESKEISVARLHRLEPPKPPLSKETETMIANEQTPEAAIIVRAALEQPHRLVAMSAKLLQRAKPVDGAARVRDHRCLDMSVSPGALDRALRIMDALLKGLETRKLPVEVTDLRAEELRHRYYEPREDDVPSNVTRVRVADEWLQLALAEKIAHKRPAPPPAPKHLRGSAADIWQQLQRRPVEYVPTGDLTLSIRNLPHLSVRTAWRDGKRQRIEGCLNDFISSLYVVADAIKAHRAEQERRHRQYEEEAKRRREEQLRAEEAARRVKELQEVIRDWRLAQDVRTYVAEARSMVAEAGLTMAEDAPFDRWLKFAFAYAEKVDPLAGLRANVARVVAEKAANAQDQDSAESRQPTIDAVEP